MNNNIPYFEVNGVGYAIKRNRYLQAELDELKKSVSSTNEEELALAKEKELESKVEKLRSRKDELYDKYLETFSEEDEQLYHKAELAYNALIEQLSTVENISGKRAKQMIDMGEKLIIKALTIDSKDGKEIRPYSDAKEIWEEFVGECGQATAIQFIAFTMNYIVGGDEDVENPFITQAKAKAEQRANMKKGIAKVK